MRPASDQGLDQIKRLPLTRTLLSTRRFLLLTAVLVLSRCVAPLPEGTTMITWYAVNPSGTLRIVLYDLVCGRHYGNLRLSSRQETAIETCADTEGVASVRYRPHGYASRVEGWTYNTIRPNQRVYLQ